MCPGIWQPKTCLKFGRCTMPHLASTRHYRARCALSKVLQQQTVLGPGASIPESPFHTCHPGAGRLQGRPSPAEQVSLWCSDLRRTAFEVHFVVHDHHLTCTRKTLGSGVHHMWRGGSSCIFQQIRSSIARPSTRRDAGAALDLWPSCNIARLQLPAFRPEAGSQRGRHSSALQSWLALCCTAWRDAVTYVGLKVLLRHVGICSWHLLSRMCPGLGAGADLSV